MIECGLQKLLLHYLNNHYKTVQLEISLGILSSHWFLFHIYAHQECKHGVSERLAYVFLECITYCEIQNVYLCYHKLFPLIYFYVCVSGFNL